MQDSFLDPHQGLQVPILVHGRYHVRKCQVERPGKDVSMRFREAHVQMGARMKQAMWQLIVGEDVTARSRTMFSALSIQKDELEGVVKDLIENVKKVRRRAKESGIILDPKLFVIDESPSPE